jgi:hypothetical protein
VLGFIGWEIDRRQPRDAEVESLQNRQEKRIAFKASHVLEYDDAILDCSPPVMSLRNFPNVCLAAALFALPLFAASSHHIQYSTVTGYFLQDLNTTNATTFDYVR